MWLHTGKGKLKAAGDTVVGARQAILTISETADLLRVSDNHL